MKKIVVKNPDGTVNTVRYECKKGVNLQPFKDLYESIKNICNMYINEGEYKTRISYIFTAPIAWE